MSRKIVFLLILLFLAASRAWASAPFRVLMAEIDGGISPASADLLRGAVATAERGGYGLLVLRLDTPGGLVESMREMVKSILGSVVPVAVWVGPAGARAASAGVFLVAASDLAAMSPQTTIGAASPVGMGGADVPETLALKAKNDLASLVRAAASAHGRNEKWYEQAVNEAVSITAREALELHVVDVLAADVPELLAQAGESGVAKHGEGVKFAASEAVVDHFEPGLRYRFLAWLLEPQVAYFLLVGAMAGLFFELTTPGAILPGVIGVLCLLPALYALSVLPTSVAGILLIALSGVLFLLEVYITSFGLLTLAAMTALFLGSTILFEPGSGMAVPRSAVLWTMGGAGAAFLAAGILVGKAQLMPRRSALEALVGMQAEVRRWEDGEGQVFVRGELWRARCAARLAAGQRVRVVSAAGLTLDVEPLEGGRSEHG